MARRPGSASRQRESSNSPKTFQAGTAVEYYSKSYDEWISAVVNTVRPDGNLRLLHDDGSVLKEQADPCLVRLVSNSSGSKTPPASSASSARVAPPKRSPSLPARGEQAREERRNAAPASPPAPLRKGGPPKAPALRPPPSSNGGAVRGSDGSGGGAMRISDGSAGSGAASGVRPGSKGPNVVKSSPSLPSGAREPIKRQNSQRSSAPDDKTQEGSEGSPQNPKFFVGDRARIKESGRLGEVMYIGIPGFSSRKIVGLRLDEKRSKNECDGKAPNGERLFRCPAGFGILLPSDEVEEAPVEEDEDFKSLEAPKLPLDFDEALSELVGLKGAKQQLTKIRQLVEVQKKRESLGVLGGKPLHFGFRGGRGTGMSTIAKTLGHLLRDLEVVTSGQVVEVSRKELLSGCNGYGDVEKQMSKLWKAATGGVLLVNEAHTLQDREKSRDDQGVEASEFIAKQIHSMLQKSSGEGAEKCWPQEVCIIVAAPIDSILPEPMQRIGFMNVDFPDYTMEELTEILTHIVKKRKFMLEEELSAEKLLRHVRDASSRGESAGEKNLVLMQRLLDEAIQRQTERVWKTDTASLQGLTTLTEADFMDSLTLTREERIRASLAKLDNVIGLKGVKNFIHSLYAQLKTEIERREAGLGGAGSAGTLHMVFSGNPGTGKTTVARIVAELLTSMRLLRKGHLVEADRAALVAGYSGQTALKTRQVVEQAMGGVLFIDEAYALVSEDGRDSFGNEALDTLIKMIEDRRQDLVVILAGYPEEMNRLIASNPGVRSRFPVQVTFEDYSEEELMQIAEKMLLDDVLILSHGATTALQQLLHRLVRTGGGGRENGNGRAVRNVLEQAKRRMAVRLQGEDGKEHGGKKSHAELCTLEAPDFE